MDDDQQFCLRWNNHQSTLVSVFDNLLEHGTLVDCTLFAEGKYLKAHKVVLSACSPYFETLLTQQYDKHPIFILKDVKYQELKAMMDYMYRGEVNISQDQLAALLKAAESLQIKGLSDSRNKENETRKSAQPPAPAKTPPPAPTPTLPRVQGLTIEQRKAPKLSESLEDSRSREGSSSPVPRKRKKPRRRPSQEGVNDNHDASSSSESHSNQAPANIPSLPAVPLASTSKLTDVPEPIETKSEAMRPKITVESPQVPIKEKQEIHSELILEPKSEYIEEEMNEDSVEDLTLDDDDVSQMEHEMDHARPGPSHGAADGSAQGFGGWHVQGNQSQDEVFLAAQEAVGAHRDSQGIVVKEEPIDTEEYPIGTDYTPEENIELYLIKREVGARERVEAEEPAPKGFTFNPCAMSIKKWKKEIDEDYEDYMIREQEEEANQEMLKEGIGYIVENEFVRPYTCTRCGKFYKKVCQIKKHISVECGKNPAYFCQYCDYYGYFKAAIKNHIKSKKHRHNMKMCLSKNPNF